jgi:AGZA family xanthine/uracil permease-like MFS transporter
MLKSISNYFKFEQLQTSFRQEVIGGVTTFISMAYIVIVNPKILQAAGIPFEASLAATIITAFFGTLTMGVYANRPFAIAPYMGENAFIAYTVVNVLGYSWQTALGAIFLGGVIFTFLTIFKIRSWLANAVPEQMKIGFAVGIGMFLVFIGLNETGIVRLGVEGAPVHIGNLTNPTVLLSILGFIVMGVLLMKKFSGAILISIIMITTISVVSGLVQVPDKIFSSPPSLKSTFLQLDIVGVFSWGFIAVIMTVFIMDFFDTLGTLIGLGYKAKLLDENGNIPEIEKPMLCDALSTVVASLLGTTTAGVYIESATGIEEGARSGFSSVIVAFLFLLTLFISPLIEIVPPYAYGPALIIVGVLMISTISGIKFINVSDWLPVISMIVLMSFTFNIGIGMTAGFILFVLFKMLDNKINEVHPGMWILALLSLLFFVFYPY